MFPATLRFHPSTPNITTARISDVGSGRRNHEVQAEDQALNTTKSVLDGEDSSAMLSLEDGGVP